MSTYEINSGNNYPPKGPNNKKINTSEHSIDANYKDKKISELRARIYDLKQREKDIDSLNQRYKQLLNEVSILNEAKLRLEYEIRQRENEYNRRITDLKGENETLQLGLNDKMTSSKKLFSENDILEREIGLKNGEINDLNGRLSDLSYQLDRTHENKNELNKIVNNLKDNNLNQDEQIFKLKQDNICLSKICQDNEKNLKMGDNDIIKLSQKIDENNYEKEFDNCRCENDKLKNELLNERSLRIEQENQNEKLKCILMEKERQINEINHDNEHIQMMNRDNNDKNNFYKIENDKLSNQVRILENQNQDIINEIDNILDEDRKMKEVLCRKNRITSLLRDNNDTLEKSINNLDTYNRSYNTYNSYNYSSLTKSPRYTYQLGERSYI